MGTSLMFPPHLIHKASYIVERYGKEKLRIITAESCTGGLLTALLTEIAGASAVLERGFVTYSNNAKIELLQVSETLLTQHGAVSRECAIAMAQGAVNTAPAEVGLAITGIAGPEGGTPEKPVGLVHLALASSTGILSHRECHFSGDRSQVRLKTVEAALALLEAFIQA